MDDLFERIINREIPASIIYEDDIVISFLDTNPINKGHALIVPKQKFINIFDADTNVLGHMMEVAKKISIAIRKATGAGGVNILMNNEEAAGQEVFHAHIHVVPRIKSGEAFEAAKHVKYEDNEINEIGQEIKKLIT